MPATGSEGARAMDEGEPESCRRTRYRHDRLSGGVSVHGLAKAREERGCTTRRTVWILILLTGLILFGCTAVDRVFHFLSRPTSFSYNIARVQDEQPKITICNLNRFRLSEVARQDWLTSSPGGNTPTIDGDVSSRRLHVDAGHRLDQMLVRCKWGARECSHDSFSSAVTEDGQCYTFNGRGVSAIQLTLNVQLNESMAQGWTSLGLKVKVHDPQQHPLFTKPYVTIPPGVDATIHVARRKVNLLASPYSDCEENGNFRSACLRALKSEYVQRKCMCTPFWETSYVQGMPSFCTLREDVDCVREKTDEYEYSGETAGCSTPCRQVRYYSSVSYSSLHAFSPTATPPDETRKRNAGTTDRIRTIVKPDDNTPIREVIRSADDILTVIAQLQENFTSADLNVFQMMHILQPRVAFHLNIGLGGVKRTVERDFTDGWFAIEEASLKPLASQIYRTLSHLDRSIRNLRKMPLSDVAVRKALYMVADNELSAIVELASRAVDNMTSVHYAYLNADPLLRVTVTPNKRYDSALVPYRLISHDTVRQTRYYNQLSENLAGHIQHATALKGVLSNVFMSNRLNESLYRSSIGQFVQHSQDFNYYTRTFRREIVMRSEDLIDSKIEAFRKLNSTMHLSRATSADAISSIQRLLQRYTTTIREEFGLVSKRQKLAPRLAQSIRTTHVMPALYDLVTELRWHCLRVSDVWRRVFATGRALWASMLDEEILRNFYFELHKDAADMLRNRSNTNFYLGMFLHETMLDVPDYRPSVLSLTDVVARLNADLATTEKGRKFAELTQLEESTLDVARDAASGLTANVDVLQRALKDLRRLSAGPSGRMTVTGRGDEHASNGLIRLNIHLNSDTDDMIVQTPSYPLTALLGDLGGLLAVFLGASIITLFEMADVLLRSVAWRTSKTHSTSGVRFAPKDCRLSRTLPPS